MTYLLKKEQRQRLRQTDEHYYQYRHRVLQMSELETEECERKKNKE
jgi:hypothetical protein